MKPKDKRVIKLKYRKMTFWLHFKTNQKHTNTLDYSTMLRSRKNEMCRGFLAQKSRLINLLRIHSTRTSFVLHSRKCVYINMHNNKIQ